MYHTIHRAVYNIIDRKITVQVKHYISEQQRLDEIRNEEIKEELNQLQSKLQSNLTEDLAQIYINKIAKLLSQVTEEPFYYSIDEVLLDLTENSYSIEYLEEKLKDVRFNSEFTGGN